MVAAAAAAEGVAVQVERAAREQLQQQAEREGWREPRFDVEMVATTRSPPACAQALDIEAVDTRLPQRMRFAVRCGDGARQVFVVRAAISAEVLVATTAVPAGRPLAAADVALQRRDIGAAPDALADAAQALGSATRRSLRAGDIVRRSVLAPVLLVRRGDAVRIVAQRDQVEVSVAAEALDAGGRGDLVRVRNASTGKVLSARVAAAGRVVPVDMWVPVPAQSRD